MDVKFTEEEIKYLKKHEGIDVVNNEYYLTAFRYQDGRVRFIVSHINNMKDPMEKFERLDVFNTGEETSIHYQTDIQFNPLIHIIKTKTPVEMGNGTHRFKVKYPSFIRLLFNKIKSWWIYRN